MVNARYVELIYDELDRRAAEYEDARYDLAVAEGVLLGQRIELRALIERLYFEATGWRLKTTEYAPPNGVAARKRRARASDPIAAR